MSDQYVITTASPGLIQPSDGVIDVTQPWIYAPGKLEVSGDPVGAADAARKATEEQQRQTSIADWCAATDDETTTAGGAVCLSHYTGRWTADSYRALAPSDVPAEIYERRSRYAATRKAARLAEQEQRAARIVGWVIEHAKTLPGNLVRAAREGRQVESAVRDWCVEQLESLTTEFAVDCGGYAAEYYGDPQTREGVPTADAYRLLDMVVARVSRVKEVTLGESVPVGEPQIVRVDVAERGSEVWRTGICFALRSTLDLGDYNLVILSEPPPKEE